MGETMKSDSTHLGLDTLRDPAWLRLRRSRRRVSVRPGVGALTSKNIQVPVTGPSLSSTGCPLLVGEPDSEHLVKFP
jgi:hypothetical protein